MREIIVGLFFALFGNSVANAAIYAININGPLPDGVTRGTQIVSASTNACAPASCAGGYNAGYSFYAQPGDTLNFGTLTLGPFIFGDGRQVQYTQYVDQNGQLQYGFGGPIGLYTGSINVSYEYRAFLPLGFSPTASCNTADPTCYGRLTTTAATLAPIQIALEYTLTDTGFIEFGWTNPSVYSAPVTAVPEASTWAMLLIGFAGISAMTYRRNSSNSRRCQHPNA